MNTVTVFAMLPAPNLPTSHYHCSSHLKKPYTSGKHHLPDRLEIFEMKSQEKPFTFSNASTGSGSDGENNQQIFVELLKGSQ